MTIANVIDTEWDRLRPIEVGLTTIQLEERRIINTYSFPIYWWSEQEVSKEITELTGWTASKLKRQGFKEEKLFELFTTKFGSKNRITIIDCNDELVKISDYLGFPKNGLNISELFKIYTNNYENLSLEAMLKYFGLEFDGKPHRANYDSLNIARLFLKLIEGLKKVKYD